MIEPESYTPVKKLFRLCLIASCALGAQSSAGCSRPQAHRSQAAADAGQGIAARNARASLVGSLPQGEHINSFAFSPDGRLLAVGCGIGHERVATPGHAHVWDTAARTRLFTFEGPRTAVVCVAFSPDGKTLATSGDEGTVIAWDLATRKPLARIEQPRPINQAGDFTGNLKFSPDGRSLLWLCDGMRAWDLEARRDRAIPPLPADVSIGGFDFGPSGEVLGLAFGPVSADRADMMLWDIFAGRGRWRMMIPISSSNEDFVGIELSPDGRQLGTIVGYWIEGRPHSRLVVRDAGTGRELATYPDVSSYAFSPDGRLLVLSFAADWQTTDKIVLRDYASGKDLADLPGASGPLVFSRDGKFLATGGKSDDTVLLWDVTKALATKTTP